MKLTCSSCNQTIFVDDSKIPAAGVFRIKCPKCERIISVSDPVDAAVSPAIEAYVAKEIAAARKEILAAMTSLFGAEPQPVGSEKEKEKESDKKSLISNSDLLEANTILTALRHFGYSVEIATTAADALAKIERNAYDLIVLSESYPDDAAGGQKIMKKLNGMKGHRRRIFLVLLSPSLKTSDPNGAFFHGSNITVNPADIQNIETLIREGQRHFQRLYRVYDLIQSEKSIR